MRVELPIKYSQLDSRWGDIILGFNPGLPWNIYNYGCLLACLAMVARYFGKDVNPLTLNDLFKSMGAGKAFKAGSGEYVSGGLHLLYRDVAEKQTLTPDLLTDAQIGEIKDALDHGFPVVIQLDYNPKTVQNDMHFVTIVDYNPNDENDFTIADPLTGGTRSLKDYLGWFKPNARNTIEQYIIFSGKVPENTSATIPVLKTDFVNIVHGSTEFDKTVNEYLPGNDPKQTSFDQVKNVINGIKSRLTDITNQLGVAQTEVENRIEQISRLKDQVLQEQKLRADLNGKLTDALKSNSGIVGVYEGQLKVKQGVIDQYAKDKGALAKQLTQAQIDLKKCQSGQPQQSILNKIKKLLGVK